MKQMFFSVFCLIFLFSACLYTEALELEFNGGINYLTFHPDRDTAHSESNDNKKFQSYPFFFGNLSVRGDISSSLALSINAVRDNILLNSINAMLYNTTDFFRFEFGPFIGMSDKMETPDAGIKGSIEFTFPGIVFFSFGGSSTLGSGFEFASGNFRESAEIRLGFWLPNVIPSVSASTKSFTRQANDFMTLRDTLTRIQLSVDIFFKNSGNTFRIDAGNETYTRVYKGGILEPTTDELNAWFVGFEMRLQVSKPMRIIAGIEMPVTYTVVDKSTGDNPGEPMIAPDFPWDIFKANAGVILTLY